MQTSVLDTCKGEGREGVLQSEAARKAISREKDEKSIKQIRIRHLDQVYQGLLVTSLILAIWMRYS